jgi:hypothetical protein
MGTNLKKDIKPNVLSDVLLSEYLLKRKESERFLLDPSWNSSESFYDFVMLYKIAMIIIALLNNELEDIGFLQVRLEFEKAVFTDGNIQKLFFYNDVKSAMDKLGELIDPQNKDLNNLCDQNKRIPWTMACLRDVGVLGDNQAIQHSRFSVIGMGWARAWLREAGIIETNPVRLAKFAIMWIDNYITVNNILKDFSPIIQT